MLRFRFLNKAVSKWIPLKKVSSPGTASVSYLELFYTCAGCHVLAVLGQEQSLG